MALELKASEIVVQQLLAAHPEVSQGTMQGCVRISIVWVSIIIMMH